MQTGFGISWTAEQGLRGIECSTNVPVMFHADECGTRRNPQSSTGLGMERITIASVQLSNTFRLKMVRISFEGFTPDSNKRELVL